jgi:hypothetical protein
MPIFISYSHQDKEFVDSLAKQLVREKVSIWLDRWELHVGDSLVSKVQDAIAGASALLVILSKASVESEWCKKELSSGLIRELGEKRVVVLPVLLEDCEIPLFLRDKLYADFRTDFDAGLRTILEAVAKVTNEWQSRLETPTWHTDWALDWARLDGGQAGIRLTLVEQAHGQPYATISMVKMVADSATSNRYWALERKGKGDRTRVSIVGALVSAIEAGLDLTYVLDDQFEQNRFTQIECGSLGSFATQISARRVGEDTGRSIVLHLGQQISQIYGHMKNVSFQGAKPETKAPG